MYVKKNAFLVFIIESDFVFTLQFWLLFFIQASKAIGWLKDVITGSQFLFSQCVLHRSVGDLSSCVTCSYRTCLYRDMKLDNLLLCGETVKIADFGSAIRLDSTMRLPFNNGIHTYM